jgi:hypothetical protein
MDAPGSDGVEIVEIVMWMDDEGKRNGRKKKKKRKREEG